METPNILYGLWQGNSCFKEHWMCPYCHTDHKDDSDVALKTNEASDKRIERENTHHLSDWGHHDEREWLCRVEKAGVIRVKF